MLPGKLGRGAQRHAFDRLVETALRLSWPVLRELFERCGYRRRSQHPLEVLKSILSSDYERLSGGYVPYSVPPQRFLWLTRPNVNDPADYEWLLVWRGLRADYEMGSCEGRKRLGTHAFTAGLSQTRKGMSQRCRA